MTSRKTVWLWALVMAPALAWASGAGAQDRHAGYYYPPPQVFETYPARVPAMPESGRLRRIGFVTGLTQQLLSAHYAPSYAVFAKGEEAEKIIIVGLADGSLSTLYRARALLATMTAIARGNKFFRENAVAEDATFLDLLNLLGFRRLTVSDGDAFAYQIDIVDGGAGEFRVTQPE